MTETEKPVPTQKKKVAARKPAVPPAWVRTDPQAWPLELQQRFVTLLEGMDTKQLAAVHSVLALLNGQFYKRFFAWYRDVKSSLPGGSAGPARKI